MKTDKIYKNSRVTFYVPDEMKKKIARAAHTQGRGVSGYCAQVLKEHFERCEK